MYAVCDSKEVVMAVDETFEIADESLDAIVSCKRSSDGFRSAKKANGLDAFDVYEKQEGIRRIMETVVSERKLCGRGFVFADCTPTKETITILLEALRSGAGVALANKVPVASEQSLYDELMRYDPRIRCESTVLAGTPAVAAVRRMVLGEDRIHRLSGTFSGTLGYVCDGLERGLLLSQVLQDAMQAGYTEPDPRDDLGGLDVARKALILARHMGWKIELSDVQVQSLYPKHMDKDKMDVIEFMKRVQEVDEELRLKVSEARKMGMVLKYVATVENGICRVGLEAVLQSSPLGRLKGTDNLLVVHSEFYDPNPLVIQGRGAGPEITAAGVLADALEIAPALGDRLPSE